ncbi:MerR family transcriptional regulator [Nocardia stercoris]|uniref:MerR family transcriptional regulator n=1 Tax=Nocardia stercoris TaxID=2483361 RepID=UPI00268AD629|nr:MerR family transcriptional regulator [Nocardia stercoris]
MNTAAVAAASGYSVQQVRDLEASGVIPAAERSESGYRRFAEVHIEALRAYRDLAHAVGPVEARRVMREIRVLPRDRAAALIGGLHITLDAERAQSRAARHALESIQDESVTDAPPLAGDSMTITELSQALGVRASTLRFWEQCGLVAPDRTGARSRTARVYSLTAIRDARITAALRAGGYRIPDVQRAITALRGLGEVSESMAALDRRLASIADRTLALLRAGTRLAAIVESAGAASR